MFLLEIILKLPIVIWLRSLSTRVENIGSHGIFQSINHIFSIKMTRSVWKSVWSMKNARYINFVNTFIVKRILQIFLGVFFLTRRNGFSILQSVRSNDIKYHLVHKKLWILFRLLLNRTVICFEYLFYMT